MDKFTPDNPSSEEKNKRWNFFIFLKIKKERQFNSLRIFFTKHKLLKQKKKNARRIRKRHLRKRRQAFYERQLQQYHISHSPTYKTFTPLFLAKKCLPYISCDMQQKKAHRSPPPKLH